MSKKASFTLVMWLLLAVNCSAEVYILIPQEDFTNLQHLATQLSLSYSTKARSIGEDLDNILKRQKFKVDIDELRIRILDPATSKSKMSIEEEISLIKGRLDLIEKKLKK